jgi:outer membrane protein assembly factor BamB
VVEAARGRLPETGLYGPVKPKMKWTISLNVSGMRIAAVGIDGTVYLTSFKGISAVRDGKLMWSYKAGMTGASNVQIDDNGLIWYSSFDAKYCVNRDGKGGRLPPSIKAPEPRHEPYRCVINHTLVGPGWKLDVEGGCARAGAVRSPEGRVYVATDMPEVLSVSAAGAIEWRHAAHCDAYRLLTTLSNQIAYSCEDHSIHGLTGANEVWKRTADGSLSLEMLADKAGTVYYGDYGRGTGVTHMHAIDARGNNLWTIDTHRASLSGLALDNKRQLYVVGSSLHSKLICLAD